MVRISPENLSWKCKWTIQISKLCVLPSKGSFSASGLNCSGLSVGFGGRAYPEHMLVILPKF